MDGPYTRRSFNLYNNDLFWEKNLSSLRFGICYSSYNPRASLDSFQAIFFPEKIIKLKNGWKYNDYR